MSVRARLQRINIGFSGPDTIAELARDALAEGEEELAAPIVLASARKLGDPRLWQWAGLLHRALDEHVTAIECLAMAVSLAPNDAKIAQALAHVSLEAGCEAEELFERALSLSPANPAVLIGLSAARMAAGHGEKAVQELERILVTAPSSIEGHAQLAQLRSLLGCQSSAPDSLEHALAKFPRERSLWFALCDLCLRRQDFEALQDVIGRAEAGGLARDDFYFYRAVAAGELRAAGADRLLTDRAVESDPALSVWRIRHLLRHGRLPEALPLIDRELQTERRQAIWPYAATAWRLAKDQRSQWWRAGGRI
jgi:tetratricopeptide (TPR) repeat protein